MQYVLLSDLDLLIIKEQSTITCTFFAQEQPFRVAFKNYRKNYGNWQEKLVKSTCLLSASLLKSESHLRFFTEDIQNIFQNHWLLLKGPFPYKNISLKLLPKKLLLKTSVFKWITKLFFHKKTVNFVCSWKVFICH